MKAAAWAASALGLALLLAGAASGQEAAEQPAAEASPEPGWGDDQKALDVWRLAGEGKTVAAREAAEALLEERPQAFEPHFLVGMTLHVEGNLPAALHHLRQARRLFEERFSARPGPETPYQWHLALLLELSVVAREMDRYEESIEAMDARNAAYQPPLPAENAWALMRLGRVAEARAAAARGLESGDVGQAAQAYTALCALESETGDRQRKYDACQKALQHTRENKLGSPNVFTNAAGAAFGVFKPDEAEKLLLEATEHFEAGNAAEPWQALMLLYVEQGRLAEAAAAARESLAWRAAQPAYLDEQLRAGGETAAALVLLVLGRGEDAVRIVERSRGRPDRTGFTSGRSAEMEAGTALLDRAALTLLAEQRAEEASWSRGRAWLSARAQAAALRLRAWLAGREGASLVEDEDALVSSLRPQQSRGVAIPHWMAGDLAEVLGDGVVAVALEKARRTERLPQVQPYYDALGAELAWRRGQGREAVSLAEQVLRSLPRAEALLRARVAAVGAQAAWSTGDTARAATLFAEALERDPAVLRRLRLALPAEVAAGDGAVARAAASRLRRSPRFQAAAGAFRVTVEGGGGSGRACLVGPAGEVRACAEVAAQRDEDAEAVAERLCAEFHAAAFAPRVDLSQADLRSLDGAAAADRQRAARRLQGVVQILTGGAGEPQK